MNYQEHKELLDKVKSKFKPGTTFDNSNINGATKHTVSESDKFAMKQGDKIVLCVNGYLDKLIVVYNNGEFANLI
jgi:hypothetical protein